MCRRQMRTHQALVIVIVLLATLSLQWLFQTLKSKIITLSSEDWTSIILYLQTGVQVKTAEEPDPTPVVSQSSTEDSPVQTTVRPPAEEPETTTTVQSLLFTDQEAEAITVSGACTYTFDKTALLQQPLAADFTTGAPQVLIVHTHTTESYTRETGQVYEELTHARTLDERYNMIRVGQQVASALEAHGIGVIHDTTINDYPAYDGAYDRMKTIIETNLAQYPTIQMVLDIHRDAAADENGNPLPLITSFADGDYAQLMLVVGTDEGGLYHPNWQQNLSTGLKLQALLERDYPQLCRTLNLRQERFNQNQTPCSLLIEFGTNGNTLSQALRSADALGEALAQLILASEE